MAIDMKKITKGKLKLKPRILVYGMDGVGKTKFACGAPRALVLDANKGSHNFDVHQRVDVGSWEETLEWTDAVADGKVECDTLVYDSLTDLEAMSHVKLFPNSSVTKHDGGWGKGDDVVNLEWRQALARIERAWLSGKTIIMVGHARVKKFEDPQGPGYDRFEVNCRPQLAGALRQWCDFVLFAREEVNTSKAAESKSFKSVTNGVRWLWTRRVPAYDAKARGTLLFTEKVLLSWNDFAAAVDRDDALGNAADIEREITAMLSELADPELDKKVRDYLKAYPAGLLEAHNSLAAKVEERRKINGT